MFVIAWRYVVRSGCEGAFERAYGAEGDWARLFGRQAGFIRTELIRIDGERAYATLDYWGSQEAFEWLRSALAAEYAALDAACGGLTESEELAWRGDAIEG